MFVVFFALWLVLNGRLTLEVALIGLALSALLYAYCVKFLGYSPRRELRTVRKIPAILRFVWMLVVEILKANISVMRLILSPSLEVEPRLTAFQTKLSDGGTRVLLANAITLTPGTITAQLEDGRYVVHCLDKSMSDGLEDSAFERVLKELEAEK